MIDQLTPNLTLAAEDAERTDLSRRSEVKFTMSALHLECVRDTLECNCRRLIHNNRVSVVRSVYFDDFHLSACRANLDGIGERRKLRLRWYDSLAPRKTAFVEIKWRDNFVTGKHRLQVDSTSNIDSMTYSQMRHQFETSMPDYLNRDIYQFQEPIVLVEYRREHFVTDDDLRITLDYDIAFYDQMGKTSISTDFPVRLEGLMVVEGKTPVGRERELRQWLYPLAPRASRFSKYVHGCREVGMIRDAEM